MIYPNQPTLAYFTIKLKFGTLHYCSTTIMMWDSTIGAQQSIYYYVVVGW